METFLSQTELEAMGFKSVGINVKVSRNALIYAPRSVELGNHVRIDDFCVLSGKIKLGNFVHLSQFVSMYGGEVGILFEDFIAVASRTMIYAISDDYVQASLETPMVPLCYKKMIEKKVTVHSHVIFGAGTIVLPGITIAEGSTFGAMALVTKDTEAYSINVGIPCKKIKNREMGVRELAIQFLDSYGKENSK